jgi:hypothetical protein
MGNVGSPKNLIVSSNWILKQETDQYILKNTLELNISRGIFRDAISLGPTYTFGAGEHSVPITLDADITKSVNWVNLNARGLDGFVTNLPYTLQLGSKSFVGTGSSATATSSITDGVLTGITVSASGSNYTSVLITLSGGTPDVEGKAVGIVSKGEVIKIIVIDPGSGYDTTPTVTITEVTSPVAFSFNAEVSDVVLSQSDNEGRVKIDATLIITDDAVLPVSA